MPAETVIVWTVEMPVRITDRVAIKMATEAAVQEVNRAVNAFNYES